MRNPVESYHLIRQSAPGPRTTNSCIPAAARPPAGVGRVLANIESCSDGAKIIHVLRWVLD